MQRELEEEAGRINGKLGDVDWTPCAISTIDEPYGFAGLFRMSRIGLVTPLRDGMNLVARICRSASADNPACLSCRNSRRSPSSKALDREPYDIEATPRIARAFTMPLEERKDRWQANMACCAQQRPRLASISCKRSPTKPKAGARRRWTKPAFQDPPAWTGLVRRSALRAPVRTAPQHWYGDPVRAQFSMQGNRRTCETAHAQLGFPLQVDQQHR